MCYFQRIGSVGLQKYMESSKDILELYFLELKNTGPAFSKKLTGRTTANSRASCCILISVGWLVTGRARSKCTGCCSLQKYGDSKSSGNKMPPTIDKTVEPVSASAFLKRLSTDMTAFSTSFQKSETGQSSISTSQGTIMPIKCQKGLEDR